MASTFRACLLAVATFVLLADAHPASSHIAHVAGLDVKSKLKNSVTVDPKNPLASHQGWVLVGDSNGPNCEMACQEIGGSCQVNKMKQVTAENVGYVASLLGQTCTSTDNGISSSDPAIHIYEDHSFCYGASEDTDCTTWFPYQELGICCCSSVPGACPVARPPAPVKGWVLSAKGQTCSSACTLAGGKCNVGTMKAMTTSDVAYVAGLLSVECKGIDVGYSGEDPSYDSFYGNCFASSMSTSCDAASSAFERFCCCSETGYCPLSA